MQPPQLFSLAIRPPFVAVIWQEFSHVQLDCCPVGRRVSGVAGSCRSLLEGLRVHPEVSLRTQHERLALACQVAGACCWIEGIAGGMKDLSQVVGGSSSAQI